MFYAFYVFISVQLLSFWTFFPVEPSFLWKPPTSDQLRSNHLRGRLNLLRFVFINYDAYYTRFGCGCNRRKTKPAGNGTTLDILQAALLGANLRMILLSWGASPPDPPWLASLGSSRGNVHKLLISIALDTCRADCPSQDKLRKEGAQSTTMSKKVPPIQPSWEVSRARIDVT